jgi:hypothetical protein
VRRKAKKAFKVAREADLGLQGLHLAAHARHLGQAQGVDLVGRHVGGGLLLEHGVVEGRPVRQGADALRRGRGLGAVGGQPGGQPVVGGLHLAAHRGGGAGLQGVGGGLVDQPLGLQPGDLGLGVGEQGRVRAPPNGAPVVLRFTSSSDWS